jgi:hypothetical protein
MGRRERRGRREEALEPLKANARQDTPCLGRCVLPSVNLSIRREAREGSATAHFHDVEAFKAPVGRRL